VPLAGGKGANLGEMVRAGLPVPPGFVVTAAGYRRFLEEASLQEEIARRLAEVDINDRHALENTADAIQDRIRAAPMPPSVQGDLLEAYGVLSRRENTDAELVAVRSSATMEDTEAASFAGMNRSFLSVRGDDDVTLRVKDVWASL
jgi:pyruvate, water dikinase